MSTIHVAVDEKQVLLSTAEEVAKDYPFEQFIADISGVTVEEITSAHLKVCGYIGQGLTPAAAISRLHIEKIQEQMETNEAIAEVTGEGR